MSNAVRIAAIAAVLFVGCNQQEVPIKPTPSSKCGVGPWHECPSGGCCYRGEICSPKGGCVFVGESQLVATPDGGAR